jgi:hypothetical protein
MTFRATQALIGVLLSDLFGTGQGMTTLRVGAPLP